MARKLRLIGIAAWWPVLALSCLGLATLGGAVVESMPQAFRDAAALCLLWFIPGASWTRSIRNGTLALRLLAALVVSLVAAQLMVGIVIALGRGLDREWVLVGMAWMTLLGVVPARLWGDDSDAEWPR